MKNLWMLLLLAMVTILSGCEVIGDIFKAGIWVGLFIAALVIGLIVYFMTRRR
ncbi:MAG TPA: phosphatidate cytidylyltransferase [Chitinophagaceae bacterium]|nr:phosphatidate cytidylyltransferase [Chitinophagaceae bacterium]